MTVTVHRGDCLEVLPRLTALVDAVVTDPPYGLEFMGKEWDSPWQTGTGFVKPGIGERETAWPSFTGSEFGGANPTCVNCGGRARGAHKCQCAQPDWRIKGEKPDPLYARHSQMTQYQAWTRQWAAAVYRVLKPGGYLLAFGGTRTYHRMACGIEDAGFEVRDTVAWLYGSGFPKSLDVSKAIDRAAGVEREVITQVRQKSGGTEHINRANASRHGYRPDGYQKGENILDITAPATGDARQWNGWGTALKPAFEPIIVARKPLSQGSVAANVLKHGTGALNIDEGRVSTSGRSPSVATRESARRRGRTPGHPGQYRHTITNRISPEAYLAEHPGEQLGRWPANVVHDGSDEVMDAFAPFGESGAVNIRISTTQQRQDRSQYRMRPTEGTIRDFGDNGSAARFFYTAKAGPEDRFKSKHPTVKPIALMCWLVKLVTAQGGTVLDPFAGSGTTGAAALLTIRNAILIERDRDSLNDIERRLKRYRNNFITGDIVDRPARIKP